MEDYLNTKSLKDLQKIIDKIGIKVSKDVNLKKKMIGKIIDFFETSSPPSKKSESKKKIKEEIKNHKSYDIYEKIGNEGKEGIVYLVKKDGLEYAMKKFKNNKSSKKLDKEYEIQKRVAKYNICPQVYDVSTDIDNKYIVMEKMDKHLIEVMKKQNGNLTKKQQLDIIKIYKKLDDAEVFHGDSNILNYMYKNRKLYVIDFGMSSFIDDALKKKLDTDTPNLTLMTIAMIIKLKELDCPQESYLYLKDYVSDENKVKYNI